MALTLRRNKSLPLTHDELDDNFEYLSSSLASITVSTSTGSFLYSGSFDGSSTVTLYSADTNYNLDLSTLSGGGGANITDLNNFTGSAYYSSSVSNATITFNQGDGTTESVTVNNVANATSASYAPNLYNSNGTLTGNRTLDFGGNSLTLDALNGESFNIAAENGATVGIALDNSTFQVSGLSTSDQPQVLGVTALGVITAMNTSSIAGSGGTPTDITDLNNFTGSAQISLDALNAATSSYVTSNLYTADGTLSGERTVTQDGNGLTFNGQGAFNTFDVSSGGRFLVSGSTNVKINGLQSGTQANIVGIDSNGQLYVQATSSIAGGGGGSGTVTSVTVSGSNGLTGSGTVTSTGTITLQHTDTSTQSSVNNSGNTFIQDVTLDGFGHVTALTSATVGATQVNSTAVYAESGTGFGTQNYSNYTVVNINSTDIQATTPKPVTGDTDRVLAIATMEVGNPGSGVNHCIFDYELYNSTQAASVAGSQGTFAAYLLHQSEGTPNTTFTFTLPISDTGVTDGDTIQLRAKAHFLGLYASASIEYASLTLLDME
jgi:hypothetical protein